MPSPIRLFASDLDGTLLGNPEASARFTAAWDALPSGSRPLLVYNSGRTVEDISSCVTENHLPVPDFIIGGVGTQIHDSRSGLPIDGFLQRLTPDWDLAKVEEIVSAIPGIERQPEQFLHDFKSSWYLHRATPAQITAIEDSLRQAGLAVTVIYSSQLDLDILPALACKGQSLDWLCHHLSIPLDSVLVAGDTANDSSMFRLPGIRGIVVENAQPELYAAVVDLPVFAARRVFADGVIDGLRHFGVIPASEPSAPQPPASIEDSLRHLFDPSSLKSLSLREISVIDEGFRRAIDTLRKNITPLGFSACSLPDNEITGTDENYHSVWARDGAITIIFSLDLAAPDIRDCARRTLCTLLDHLSPGGQIPANVRISTATPDYSGVGGICSIDSGLWVIIAAYHYVNTTGDHGFLDSYLPRLQRAMDWLSAHDGNNDGLLEIPEAGDWTDLFGRSYNILYDEILWYRANVCFGRLLEFCGHFDRAADYLNWSQFIRGEILANFWPSTQADPSSPSSTRTFADQQFSLGDAQFLLAQLSPFSFSWRCDVLGNILAFLMNVLDSDRARSAFRFMWGVGVNEPAPVSNLYPVVQAGDPDWRPYYTVNLLNLPQHYHNGGIWPFIGGMWVRFIYRLGLGDVASRELLRLAQLNQQGRQSDWEFNEWMHGRTARPMGKRFQAWSAASYIKACVELSLAPGKHLDDH